MFCFWLRVLMVMWGDVFFFFFFFFEFLGLEFLFHIRGAVHWGRSRCTFHRCVFLSRHRTMRR